MNPRRLGARAVALLMLSLMVGFSLMLSSIPSVNAQVTSSPWESAAEYPLQVGGTFGVAAQQCVNSTVYVTCIGGQDANGGPRNEVYSSFGISPSSSNITSWTSDTNQYPQYIHGQSCVVYSGYVYCVGGTYNDNGDDVAASYYAKLGGVGQVGNWSSTMAFPIPIDSQSCVASSSYIYCVGGVNEIDGSKADAAPSNSVWYAQLSSSGVGSWNHSTAYPGNIYYPSCFAAKGYIYCLGGADSNDNSVSTDYYATLSSAGVGTWTQTIAYPVQASGQACAISSGYIYCVGGETAGGQSPSYTNAVYYAAVSNGGIGTWKQAANFPLSVGTTCVISSGNMYCVGGFDGSSVGENGATYYVPLDSLSVATTTVSSTSSVTTTTTITVTSATTSTTTQMITSTTTTTTTLPPSTSTTTATLSVPTTITGPTSTTTATTTSIVTETNSVVPTWAYGVMAVLLIVGLAIGYVIRKPSLPKP